MLMNLDGGFVFWWGARGGRGMVWVIPGSAQRLFLALCSGVSRDSALGTMCGAGDQARIC